MRRPATPTVLAWLAVAAGVISIISALTPEFADRTNLINGILPPGVPDAARTIALALGIGLTWLSLGLARRKHRAWQLAVGVVIASAVMHLVKGLDFEEATAHLILLAALWRTRRQFVAPGDPATIMPVVQVALGIAVLVPVLVLHLTGDEAWSPRLSDAALGLTILFAARGLWLWLRPSREVSPPCAEDWARAAELVNEHGRDSLSYFALRRDKSYFFSPSGKSFIPYRVIRGTALVAGDPIGEPAERGELMREFVRVAHTKAWRVAIAGASGDALTDYADLGFKSIYLGDEAVVKPSEFSLEGRAIRKVRQSVSRLSREGYEVRVLSVSEAGALRDELREVSEEWRGNWPERGFTMAMDALFLYPDTVLAVAVGPDGSVGGFLQLVPSPASEGYSLASMRRRHDTPNGLMEYLITETIAWAREHNVTEVSLNFAVFADFMNADEDAGRWSRLFRWALLKGDRLFQLERLHSFNRKFFPNWRRRYFCFERWTDLPLAGLAYLHAESLLTPPGPWVKTPDLAAR